MAGQREGKRCYVVGVEKKEQMIDRNGRCRATAAAPSLLVPDPHVQAIPVQARPSRSAPLLFIYPALTLVQASRRSANQGTALAQNRRANSLTTAISLVLRFVKDQFDDYRESTIGGPCAPILPHNMLILQSAAFLTQTVTLDDQTTVKFEIW